MTSGNVPAEREESPTPEADRLLANAAPQEVLTHQTAVKAQGQLDDLKLKRRVGNGALIVMIVQVGIADAAFLFYGFANDWQIPTGAITGWLAATVIQVVSIVVIITKYLFPGGKRK